MKKWAYFLSNLVCWGIPTLVAGYFVWQELRFWLLVPVLLLALFVGGIFDIWAAKQGNRDKFYIWDYNDKTILGIKIGGVPVEDYLFFMILVPVTIIVVWELVKKVVGDKAEALMPVWAGILVVIVVMYVVTFRLSGGGKKTGKRSKKRR